MGELIATLWKALSVALPTQVRLRLVACTAFILVVLLYVLALGYVPEVFPGFARTDAVTQMRASLDEDAVDELRTQQCHMQSGSAKMLYAQTIQKRQQDYQRLMHEQLQLPACGDL